MLAHLGAARMVLIGCAHRGPKLGVDDAQLGHLAHLPFLLGPVHVAALAGLGILEPLPAIPDQPSNVDLAVQQASATLAVADESGYGPSAAARARDAFVEAVRDAARAAAFGIIFEDATDHAGLIFDMRRRSRARRVGATANQSLDDQASLAALESPLQNLIEALDTQLAADAA